MSKKQNQKKKLSIKINAGEAVFVAPIEILTHIAETYVELGNAWESSEERDSFLAIADSIYQWSNNTYFNPEDGYEDEEW